MIFLKHFFDNFENIRQTIMDHYQNPRNRGLLEDDSYIKLNLNSTSCVDNIDIQVKVEKNKIKDFRFDGVGCAISIASTSILSELIKGKTIKEALEIIDNFISMLYEKKYNYEILGEALCFVNTKKQPARIKCASLSWDGLKSLLENREKVNK